MERAGEFLAKVCCQQGKIHTPIHFGLFVVRRAAGVGFSSAGTVCLRSEAVKLLGQRVDVLGQSRVD